METQLEPQPHNIETNESSAEPAPAPASYDAAFNDVVGQGNLFLYNCACVYFFATFQKKKLCGGLFYIWLNSSTRHKYF